MPVTEVTSPQQFSSLQSSSQLLVVDFFATWCGPCRAISPLFDRLSDKSENSAATFARLDVDKVKSVAQECGITAMPTFLFYKAGRKVDEMKGANAASLEAKVKMHLASLASATSSSLVRGMISLNDKIDIKQLEILNAPETSSVRDLLSPGATSSVASDSDEQLMVYVPFQESIKVHSLVLRVDPESADHAPTALKLYVNRPNILSFDDVGSVTPTQEFLAGDFTYNDDGEALVALRYVKFQKVNSLVIFVEQNKTEDDVTMVRSLEFLGAVESTNSSGVVKKIDHDHD